MNSRLFFLCMAYPTPTCLYLQGHRRLLMLFPCVWTCSEERFMQAVAAVKVSIDAESDMRTASRPVQSDIQPAPTARDQRQEGGRVKATPVI